MIAKEDLNQIVEEVLSAIRTHSLSIDQLTAVSKMDGTEFLEINAGRKVQISVLVEAFLQLGIDGAIISRVKAESDIRRESDDSLSQRITEGILGVQNQIDSIVAGNTKLSVSVTPGTFFEGEPQMAKVTATLSQNTGVIKIYRGSSPGGTLVKTSEGKVSSQVFTETEQPITATTSYYAEAEVTGGTVKGNNVTAYAYKPFYVGAGKAYTEVMVEEFKHGPSSHSRGNYSFDAVENDFVYLILPNTMPEPKVTFVDGGFGLPVSISGTETLEGYKIYVSGKRAAGNYKIKVS